MFIKLHRSPNEYFQVMFTREESPCKILKMLIFLQFIPAKQGFDSSISLKFPEMQELKLFQHKKKFFWYKLFCRCKGLFFGANIFCYVHDACLHFRSMIVHYCFLILVLLQSNVHFQMTVEDFSPSWTTEFKRQFFNCHFPS